MRRNLKISLERGGPKRTVPQQDLKKVNNVEKGFQTDGNQRDTPPFRWLIMRLRAQRESALEGAREARVPL